jgi:NADH dehydrogenase [ubiquinone] 1 alpha subcomplex assembly factor 1
VYSRQLNKGASERLKRSGFAGISARAGRYLDLDEFHSIIFNVQGDGRTYLANIRTDNWVVGENAEDVWQAFLFARAGEWCEVEIPLDRFLLTWRGKLVEQEVEMNRARITGIGISIAGGDHLQEEGEFALGLRSVCVKSNASLDSLDD